MTGDELRQQLLDRADLAHAAMADKLGFDLAVAPSTYALALACELLTETERDRLAARIEAHAKALA